MAITEGTKEIAYKDTGDVTGWNRWRKAAVDESVAQIWGAERWLNHVDNITRRDGRVVTLPPRQERRYHRIAVALGGQGEVPIAWGDLGNGFVHVCDEYSLSALFDEADSINDLLDYLMAVEALMASETRPIVSGSGLEDLLAVHVVHGDSFGFVGDDGKRPDVVIVDEGIWKSLVASDDYRKHIEGRRPSYAWDRLIEHLTDDLLTDGMQEFRSAEVTTDLSHSGSMSPLHFGHA